MGTQFARSKKGSIPRSFGAFSAHTLVLLALLALAPAASSQSAVDWRQLSSTTADLQAPSSPEAAHYIRATAGGRNNLFDGVTNSAGIPVTIGGVRSHNRYRNVPAGQYTMTAKATDNGGATVTSRAATIRVTDPEPPHSSWYVSRNGNNVDGKSWTTAWQDLSQIHWPVIEPGDVIYIDGGGAGMAYAPFTSGKGGTGEARIRIERSLEPSHDGHVTIGSGIRIEHPYITLDGRDQEKFLIDATGGYTIRVMETGDFFELRNASVIGDFSADWGSSLYITSGTALISRCLFEKNTKEDMIKYYPSRPGTLTLEYSLFKDNVNNDTIHRDVMETFTSHAFDLTVHHNIFLNTGDLFLIAGDWAGAAGRYSFYYNVFMDGGDVLKFKRGTPLEVTAYNNVFRNVRDFPSGHPGVYINNLYSGKNSFGGIVHVGGGTTTHSLWDIDAGAFEPGTGNIQADPQFVDVQHPLGADGLPFTSDDGLRLKPTSPARDAGQDVGLTEDIVGNPIVGAPDIGAYEYKADGGGNLPPKVSVTKPASGATFPAGSSIALEATASDPDGNVAEVQFLEGSNLLQTDATSPYGFTWRNVPAGQYALTAKAKDNAGAITVSSPVSVTVGAPPNGGFRYIRPGATGANTGADWANAYTQLPSSLVRGVTYYLADGSYPNYTFDDPQAGTKVITMKKATATDHGTSTGWQAGYGDGQASWGPIEFQSSYWVFDGQQGFGTGTQESYGFRISYRGTDQGVKLVRFSNSPSYITMRHVDMEHAGAVGDYGHDIIYSLGGHHYVFSYCYMHDVSRYPVVLDNTDDTILEYSYIARNESTPIEHGEGVFGVNASRIIVRYSIFEDIEGTTAILMSGADAWEIYGNVIFWTPAFNRSTYGNGAIGTWSQPQYFSTNARIYNNVFANLTDALNGGLGLKDGNNVAHNNLWYNVARPRLNGASHDYNACFACVDTSSISGEAHGQVGAGNPFEDLANKHFRLVTGTAAGLGLSSPYDRDPDGNIRGGDGVWDRGAFEFSGTADATPPVISGVASSSVTASGATITWTTDEASDSQVEYGTSTAYGSSTALVPSLVTSHSQALSGLAAGTLYHVRVKSKDASGNLATSADFTFTTAAAGGGTLTGSRAAWTTTTNLTAAGTLDWAHWGNAGSLSMNHKNGVAQQISSYTALGTVAPAVNNYFHGNASVAAVSWSDGTPTASVAGTSGMAWIDTRNVSGDGFQLTAPADTSNRTLKLYAGNWCQRTKVQASLSDGSAPALTDTSWDVTTPVWQTSVYTLSYAAASSGQSLTVKVTIDLNHCLTGDVGEIGLYAATLANPVLTDSFYVRPNGGSYGREDGTDWNNAFDGFGGVQWGNGPGQVGAARTLYVAGGTYTSELELKVGGSDAGRLIIKRATTSDHGTDAGWLAAFDRQVLLNDVSIFIFAGNLTIDGQVPNGIRITTPTKGRAGVNWPSVTSSNVTLRYLQIEGPGYRIPYDGVFGSRGIDLTPSQGGAPSHNILIEHCDIFNQPSQIYLLNVDGVTVQYCTLHHGGDLTTGPTADHENVIYAESSDNVTVRFNEIHDNDAEGVFLTGGSDNWDIYANTFYDGGLGVEARQDVGPHKNVNVYNNTFVNVYGPIRYRGNSDTGEARNNILYPNAGAIIWGPGITHDYNWYGGNDAQGEAHGIAGGSENPFVNSAGHDFYLKPGASPIDRGYDLGSRFDTDKDGVRRPQAGAWDIGAYELPGAQPLFADVPQDHWARPAIEALYLKAYVSGCSAVPLKYCPDSVMTRAESAVFVERGVHGAGYLPEEPTTQDFADVPLGEWFAKWAAALLRDRFTTGCGTAPLVFCPLREHTRAEATVFFERMLNGADYVPPQPSASSYGDVPLEAWFAKWVEAAQRDGLLAECEEPPNRGDPLFRPLVGLTRAEAACMMARAKGLP